VKFRASIGAIGVLALATGLSAGLASSASASASQAGSHHSVTAVYDVQGDALELGSTHHGVTSVLWALYQNRPRIPADENFSEVRTSSGKVLIKYDGTGTRGQYLDVTVHGATLGSERQATQFTVSGSNGFGFDSLTVRQGHQEESLTAGIVSNHGVVNLNHAAGAPSQLWKQA
jgi:hypothetical protein